MIYFVAQSVTERMEKVTAPIVNAQFAPDLVRFLNAAASRSRPTRWITRHGSNPEISMLCW